MTVVVFWWFWVDLEESFRLIWRKDFELDDLEEKQICRENFKSCVDGKTVTVIKKTHFFRRSVKMQNFWFCFRQRLESGMIAIRRRLALFFRHWPTWLVKSQNNGFCGVFHCRWWNSNHGLRGSWRWRWRVALNAGWTAFAMSSLMAPQSPGAHFEKSKYKIPFQEMNLINCACYQIQNSD